MEGDVLEDKMAETGRDERGARWALPAVEFARGRGSVDGEGDKAECRDTCEGLTGLEERKGMGRKGEKRTLHRMHREAIDGAVWLRLNLQIPELDELQVLALLLQS
jgi:hypothetical protein